MHGIGGVKRRVLLRKKAQVVQVIHQAQSGWWDGRGFVGGFVCLEKFERNALRKPSHIYIKVQQWYQEGRSIRFHHSMQTDIFSQSRIKFIIHWSGRAMQRCEEK